MTPRLSRILLFALLAALVLPAAFAQRGEGPLDPAQPQGITPDEIIRRFAAKEKEFKEAREQYTYTQNVTVQTLEGDTVDGEFHQVVDITYDDKGRRIENVTFAPQPSLTRISMSPEDFQDIEHLMPFVLTTEEIPDYNIRYVGQQQEDELGTYVFDISPKSMQKGRRYFEGRIWVDNQDFQIVKTYGKSVPDLNKGKNNENLFPKFVTYRTSVDEHYWFPAYTRADDVLHFSNQDVHIRETVRYENYKRFGSKSRIIYQGQEVPKGPGTGTTPQGQQPGGTQQPPPTPPPPKR